jgi:hypothetical protein
MGRLRRRPWDRFRPASVPGGGAATPIRAAGRREYRDLDPGQRAGGAYRDLDLGGAPAGYRDLDPVGVADRATDARSLEPQNRTQMICVCS